MVTCCTRDMRARATLNECVLMHPQKFSPLLRKVHMPYLAVLAVLADPFDCAGHTAILAENGAAKVQNVKLSQTHA
jgi:hypothetical protein